MAIDSNFVTPAELRDHLSFTEDIGPEDDDMLGKLATTAQHHIDALLGYRLADLYGPASAGMTPLPLPLKLAILQLAAWWYLHRETAALEGRPVETPFGVRELVAEYREWTF